MMIHDIEETGLEYEEQQNALRIEAEQLTIPEAAGMGGYDLDYCGE